MAHNCDLSIRAFTSQWIHLAFCLAATVCSGVWFESSALASPSRVATFRCDVTPWPGEPLVWTAKLVKVEDSLLAKGIVLEAGTNRYVICAIDWCVLGNDSNWPSARHLRVRLAPTQRASLSSAFINTLRRTPTKGAPSAGCRAESVAAPQREVPGLATGTVGRSGAGGSRPPRTIR